MKKILFPIFLIILSLTAAAQPMSDKAILEDIRQNPYCAAAGHCPYFGGEFFDTPAPDGYSAFYVSHLGRHGSRYQGDSKGIKAALELMDKLHKEGLLTVSGDSLRTEIQHIESAHKGGMAGMLTGKGTREHTMIASNLARRCPEIFQQKDRNKAVFTSTPVARTIQSMAGFSIGILKAAPQLEIELNSGFKGVEFRRDKDKSLNREEVSKYNKELQRQLSPTETDLSKLAKRLITDNDAAKNLLGEKTYSEFFTKVFIAACGAGCLDIKVNPLRFFTPDELFAFYKMNDARFNVSYGTMGETREDRAKTGLDWARRIVNDADAALEGNGHCADFRFGHDGNIGPMMNLLAIGPFQYSSKKEAPYQNWQSYRYICMGSNLQMIFYHNAGGDVLVKALYNEREIDFPGLKAINNVYYKWSDVRRYIISKTDEIREVPSYYKKYLKAKAAEIAKLQKDEADGFYFITDTHYPVNAGNSPAIIESLVKSTGRRTVILGGDVLTYLDDMDDAMAMQVSAVEQIRGVAPFYWVRGNHDFVNYTGKKEWITKSRKALYNWDSADFMARYTSENAVRNPDAPYSSYYYFDNPQAGIRYVVAESTDDVKDNKIIYGISQQQLKWLAEEAVLKAPEGYRILFFSHVPPIGHDNQSIVSLAKMIDAFSFHKTFSIGNTSIDFSTRKDLTALGIICAHKHKDFEKQFGNGLFQINVEADCNYNRQKAIGTVNEQSFEYFSISKDYKTIRTVKIGAGNNREYKLN